MEFKDNHMSSKRNKSRVHIYLLLNHILLAKLFWEGDSSSFFCISPTYLDVYLRCSQRYSYGIYNISDTHEDKIFTFYLGGCCRYILSISKVNKWSLMRKDVRIRITLLRLPFYYSQVRVRNTCLPRSNPAVCGLCCLSELLATFLNAPGYLNWLCVLVQCCTQASNTVGWKKRYGNHCDLALSWPNKLYCQSKTTLHRATLQLLHYATQMDSNCLLVEPALGCLWL